MDFLTHSLIGTGAARLLCGDRRLRPQAALAAILGSTLMDGDAFVAIFGPDAYGRYHRVVSHSFLVLIPLTFLAAGIAHWSASHASWRRFGYFVIPREPVGGVVDRIGFGLLLKVAASAAALHWIFDVITGFGNMTPFWPFSRWDASLRAVYSFDTFIFSMTLAWHLTTRQLDWPRRRELLVGAAWLMIVGGYVVLKLACGVPAIW